MNVGRSWVEVYNPIFAGKVIPENFLSWLRWAWNTQTTFTITHPTTPGSGVAPNGTGSAGVTVGSGLTGAGPITTYNWPLSTSNVVRAGDLLEIANYAYTVEVTDDANSDGSGVANIYVNPPLWEAPSGGSAITTTGAELSVKLMDLDIPEMSNSFYYDQIRATFREAV